MTAFMRLFGHWRCDRRAPMNRGHYERPFVVTAFMRLWCWETTMRPDESGHYERPFVVTAFMRLWLGKPTFRRNRMNAVTTSRGHYQPPSSGLE